MTGAGLDPETSEQSWASVLVAVRVAAWRGPAPGGRPDSRPLPAPLSARTGAEDKASSVLSLALGSAL